jgi:hypothetical protein
MTTLWKYELYKILHNKIALGVIAFFIPFYIYTSYSHYFWRPGIAWERIVAFPFSFGSLFEGMVILLALSGTFTNEYILKTDSIILSSRYGRKETVTAKIAAAAIFISMTVIAFWIINLSLNLWFAEASGWTQPIQDLPRYNVSPYALTIWQYCIVQFFTNWLGCIVFGLFVLMLSVYNKAILVVFFVGGIVFTLPFLIRNISDFSIVWTIKNMSPTEYMRVESMYNRVRFLRIEEWSIPLPLYIFYIYIAAMMLAFTRVIYRRFEAHEVV